MKTIVLNGYAEQLITNREMRISDLVYTVCNFMIRERTGDVPIRIVDCHSATINKYTGIDDFLHSEWTPSWRINVYQISILNGYIMVIISDEIEQ